MIDDDEFGAWFRLLETPGIGRATARALLSSFGSPQAVWAAPEARWRAVIGPKAAQRLAAPGAELEARLQVARGWLAADDAGRRHVLTIGDPDYPPLLLHAPDPPLLLYVQGQRQALQAPAIAMVGSRNPSPQGVENAREFARHLGQAGWVVVSGLALGVDAAAHEGALQGGAPTIAVVGTGLDRVYPSRHRALAHRIGETGAVVSEFPPGTPPVQANFPLRNRIIAGLSRGTLVVEAALLSGSLITARLASESGREVFAIPGSIHSPLSRGCHALIKQGAKLVESARDILEELGGAIPGSPPETAPPRAPGHDADEEACSDPLLEALGHDPVTLDALGLRTGEGAAALQAQLLELELAGQVARLPGGLYQRRGQA